MKDNKIPNTEPKRFVITKGLGVCTKGKRCCAKTLLTVYNIGSDPIIHNNNNEDVLHMGRVKKSITKLAKKKIKEENNIK